MTEESHLQEDEEEEFLLTHGYQRWIVHPSDVGTVDLERKKTCVEHFLPDMDISTVLGFVFRHIFSYDR